MNIRDTHLKQFKFREVIVTSEESGCEKDYRYWVKDLSKSNSSFCLISDEKDLDSNDPFYWVYFFDVKEYKIKRYEKLVEVIELFKSL